jgi:hypothetical protein
MRVRNLPPTGEDRSVHVTRAHANLEGLPEKSARTDVQKVALSARILAGEGHFGGLADQLTARIAETRFLTLGLGTAFDEANPSDFIVVDDDLNVISGEGIPNPATRFHLWIYKQKPLVRSIIHTHPPATSALSMIGQPLLVAHMDMCMFQDQCPIGLGFPSVTRKGWSSPRRWGAKKPFCLRITASSRLARPSRRPPTWRFSSSAPPVFSSRHPPLARCALWILTRRGKLAISCLNRRLSK